jgi:hypothetical protein
MRPKALSAFAIALTVIAARSHAEPGGMKMTGRAWLDMGRIMKAVDTLSTNPTNPSMNFEGNWLQSYGAQATVYSDISDHWQAAMGFGTRLVSHSQAGGSIRYFSISLFQHFITQSRLTGFLGEKESPDYSFDLGAIPYHYNRHSANFGSYLLRGPVYPGILMGGFKDFGVDPTKANLLGSRLHAKTGSFQHDLILTLETDVPPLLDQSLAYVVKFQPGEVFELGAGVNFYHLLPYKKELETPGKTAPVSDKAKYVEVDPVSGDTVFFTHQGIKLMAMFSLDIKKLVGLSAFGAEDLKLYGEAALLGVKNYGKTYGKRAERIPVTLGFNLPAFGLVDRLSVEGEWYGAKYRNDLANIGYTNGVADWTRQEHPIPSPKPVMNSDFNIDSTGTWNNRVTGASLPVKGTALDKENLTSDDFKWSINLEKMISGSLQLSIQVANDHYRPRPVALQGYIFSDGGTKEAFAAKSDWYTMLRMSHFF